jgi:hypothetical protein
MSLHLSAANADSDDSDDDDDDGDDGDDCDSDSEPHKKKEKEKQMLGKIMCDNSSATWAEINALMKDKGFEDLTISQMRFKQMWSGRTGGKPGLKMAFPEIAASRKTTQARSVESARPRQFTMDGEPITREHLASVLKALDTRRSFGQATEPDAVTFATVAPKTTIGSPGRFYPSVTVCPRLRCSLEDFADRVHAPALEDGEELAYVGHRKWRRHAKKGYWEQGADMGTHRTCRFVSGESPGGTDSKSPPTMQTKAANIGFIHRAAEHWTQSGDPNSKVWQTAFAEVLQDGGVPSVTVRFFRVGDGGTSQSYVQAHAHSISARTLHRATHVYTG